MDEIKFTVTIDEANLILEGLGHLPFAKVFGLVAKVQEQASGQLSAENVQAENVEAENVEIEDVPDIAATAEG